MNVKIDQRPGDDKRIDSTKKEHETTLLKKGDGTGRGVTLSEKPEDSISLVKIPFIYIGLKISHLFSRIIDSAYSDIGQFARRTERTLDNPFTPNEEKRAALDSLIDKLSERQSTSPRESEEIEDVTADILKKLKREDAERLKKAADTFISTWQRFEGHL